MRPADLPAVMAIQAACYGRELLEPDDVLRARLMRADDTCWVAERAGRVSAYLAAYRSELGAVTPLHAVFRPAPVPDTLYVHDLAVDPAQHGAGLGARLVEALLAQAGGEGLAWAALVAVQGAADFWERLGFAARSVAGTDHRAGLATYGASARYMVKPLAG